MINKANIQMHQQQLKGRGGATGGRDRSEDFAIRQNAKQANASNVLSRFTQESPLGLV